ncbi:MAG TPA: polymer-forming cytoskeletal protein [Candidatus Aquilonibacter sp.]|nr:polymer-forming cytoskeletal protein [Candidatus Aquilonibacter sp.]
MSPIDENPQDRLAEHFDEMTGLLYLERQLDAERARAVEAHVAACLSCRELLRALENEAVWLREALVSDDESIPARVLAEPQRGTIGWGWIVAFGLGIGGAYTLWTGVIQPSLTQAAQAGFTQGNILTMLFFTGAFWKGWDTMRSLPEFLAAATLGGVAVWLLRRHWQRFTTIAFVMGALVCMLGLPPSAAAAETKHGDPNYTLAAGEDVKNDLIVLAARARIDGDVDGDLISFSNSLIVNGHVKGDVIAFGQEIIINGPVDGNVRAWGQSLSLNGPITRNVSTWAAQLEVDQKATIGGSLMLLSQSTEIDGQVGGDFLALVADITINGKLGRDASIRGDRLTIGSTGEIDGQTKYVGRRQPEVASGAKLASPIQVTIPRRGPDYTHADYYWHQVLLWGASFLFGLVLLLLAPGLFSDVVHQTKKAGPALGFGVLFFLATPIAIVIACVTIVGIGLGVSALFLYLISMYAAQVFFGSWIGELLLGFSAGVGPAVGRLALGLAVVRALLMIPFAGGWIWWLITAWGMGALILAAYHRMGHANAQPAAA